MEINGIRIRDMKDVQDVLMALETIKSGIENISDGLSENYEDYNSVSEDIANSVSSQKELIESISNIQIKASDIIDNINILNNNTKSINSKTINTIKTEFEEFDRQIENTMSSAINSIDLSTFRRQIESLFDKKITSLEVEVERLKNNNNNLEKFNSNIKKTLRNEKEDIEDTLNNLNYDLSNSINKFNKLSKVVNWKVILSVGLAGMFAGALLMMFVGLNIAKKQVFKDELTATKSYNDKKNELDSKYANASELEKVAREYGIKLIIDNEGNKNIVINSNKVKNAYKSETNYFVWKLK